MFFGRSFRVEKSMAMLSFFRPGSCLTVFKQWKDEVQFLSIESDPTEENEQAIDPGRGGGQEEQGPHGGCKGQL